MHTHINWPLATQLHGCDIGVAEEQLKADDRETSQLSTNFHNLR